MNISVLHIYKIYLRPPITSTSSSLCTFTSFVDDRMHEGGWHNIQKHKHIINSNEAMYLNMCAPNRVLNKVSVYKKLRSHNNITREKYKHTTRYPYANFTFYTSYTHIYACIGTYFFPPSNKLYLLIYKSFM